ncbi:MAG: ribosome-associated translation inhibitor RaiA [Oscillospiraceae bacterium]|nr:ribosome-associated translation inhibitor RaiA [Oscillospiraceae bacterium]
MKVNYTGRQLTVPGDFREFAEKKLERMEKYFADGANVSLKLLTKRNFEVVEVTIVDAGTIFRSEQSSDAFLTSLDRCLDAIERQIRKNKTKLSKRLRDNAFVAEPAPTVADEIDEQDEFKIRTKSFSFKPMSAQEAILQMNLLGHSFFVFEDDTTGQVNVVYTRADGEYGLITQG